MRHLIKAGARCGSSARRDLYGGCPEKGHPYRASSYDASAGQWNFALQGVEGGLPLSYEAQVRFLFV